MDFFLSVKWGLTYSLLCLLLLIPLLWKISSKFRYLTIITMYYLCILLAGCLSLPVAMLRPRNPENHRVVRWIFINLSCWMNIKWETRGMEIFDELGPCVILANHQSSLDILGMMYLLPNRAVALIKKSLYYIPLWGWCAHLSGSVFIDRYNRENAVETMGKLIDYVKENNIKLWVFPEGTRHRQKGLLPFKKGGFHLAVQAQIPLVPIVFSSFEPFYSKSEMRIRTGGTVVVQVLKPITTVGLKSEDVSELTESTRAKMLEIYETISKEAVLRNAPQNE